MSDIEEMGAELHPRAPEVGDLLLAAGESGTRRSRTLRAITQIAECCCGLNVATRSQKAGSKQYISSSTSLFANIKNRKQFVRNVRLKTAAVASAINI